MVLSEVKRLGDIREAVATQGVEQRIQGLRGRQVADGQVTFVLAADDAHVREPVALAERVSGAEAVVVAEDGGVDGMRRTQPRVGVAHLEEVGLAEAGQALAASLRRPLRVEVAADLQCEA